jgi:Transposase DDE domain
MEGELFELLYALVQQEAKLHSRPKRVCYSDALILLVYFWSVLHDRPVCWACQWRHWPEDTPFLSLPSAATMSRRLKTLSCCLFLAGLYHRLRTCSRPGLCLCRRLDTKPLVVSGFSKDRDARRGYATGGLARGYKMAAIWGHGLVPDALGLASLNVSDQQCAMNLIDSLAANGPCAAGYLLADSTHETNPLHEYAMTHGFQLLAPRKKPGTGLGHIEHSQARLRCIELLETDTGNDFGKQLYRLRGNIERDLGHLCSFGGGLQSLPSWVRHPRRVARWIIAKLTIRALRICQIKGLAA